MGVSAMLVYDRARGEVIDSKTGLVVVDHVIGHGPEWRSYRPRNKEVPRDVQKRP